MKSTRVPNWFIIAISLLIGLSFVLGVVGFYLGWTSSRRQFSPPPPTGGVACILEAKLCPDGSYVSRTGSNCEFASCPSEK